MLVINFASVHTTANVSLALNLAFEDSIDYLKVLTQAIYRLAMYPEYTARLREEVEVVQEKENGWTHAALTKMHNLDSFLRETMRNEGLGQCITLTRAILCD